MTQNTDLERQYLLLSSPHVKVYPSGHHFSCALPAALEGRVDEHRYRQTVETVNEMWSPATKHLGKVFLVSLLALMVSLVAPFVLILHWVTPRDRLLSIWVPIDIALIAFNIVLFLVILFRSTKTKRNIRDFLEQENQQYNRVGLNFRFVQEKTLAGFMGDIVLYIDLLPGYGPPVAATASDYGTV